MKDNETPLFDGETLRDEGTASVFEHEAEEWKMTAALILDELIASGRDFTASDLRVKVGDPPHHPNAMGAVFLKALRSGRIERVGYVASNRVLCHAHRNPVYRRVR